MEISSLHERLDDFGRRLGELEADFVELRLQVEQAESAQRSESGAVAASPEEWAPSPAWSAAGPEPEPGERERVSSAEVETGTGLDGRNSEWRELARRRLELPPRQLDLSVVFGGRALAWLGGLVTLLGIALLFVLAVNRGWIGPATRVGIGAVLSCAVLAGGIGLRHRFGQTYTAMACVGTGVAGAFATLAASTLLYDFVSLQFALLAAAGIATVAVAVALAWQTEAFALLGLVGAMAAPLGELQSGSLSVLGVGYALLVLAAAGTVGVTRGWRGLLSVSGTLAGIEVAVMIADRSGGPLAGPTALAGVFAAQALAIGILHEQRTGSGSLRRLAISYVLGSAAFVSYAAFALFDGRPAGIALLIASGTYLGVGAALFRPARELGAFVIAVGLALLAAGVGAALDGPSVTLVWAADAALLAWLAGKVGERRFRLASLGYLALGLAHALAGEAAPVHLLRPALHPASGVPSVLYLAAASAAFAIFLRGAVQQWEPGGWTIGKQFDRMAHALEQHARAVRVTFTSVAAALGLYAVSLSLLELFQWAGQGGIYDRFDWGHVAVSGMLGAVTLALLLAGRLRRSWVIESAAVCLAIVTVAKLVAFDLPELPDDRWPLAFLAAGFPLLAYTFLLQRFAEKRDEMQLPVVVLHPVTLAVLVTGMTRLVDGGWQGVDLDGVALLGLAGLYAALATLAFRTRVERDHATALGLAALGLALAAFVELLAGSLVVLVIAGLAAGLAWLGRRLGEPRLYAGALASWSVGLGSTLGSVAPPVDLFRAAPHPGNGAPAAVYLALAGAAIAAALTDEAAIPRRMIAWAGAALAVYAGMLGILEAFQVFGGQGVALDFQHAQPAVSGFLGVVGLGLLAAGLLRRSSALRVGGLVLFAASVGKIFLFDLPNLSSITRALSFLAVGALLLVAGFLAQRWSERREGRTA